MLLRSLNIKPKKRLGQHFLLEQKILKRIVELVDPSAGDIILEIGAGLGEMTIPLAEKGARVICSEIDEDLIPHLKERIAIYPNIELIHGDILRYDIGNIALHGAKRLKVVGNLPFNISSQILFKVLEDIDKLKIMVLTFQKEVCDRLLASPGSKDYGILTVLVSLHCEIKKAFTISSAAFFPTPKVDSAVVIMKVLPAPRVEVGSKEVFVQVVKGIFNQRRKTLRRTLINVIQPLFPFKDVNYMLKDLGIEGQRRGETLTVEEFSRISRWIEENRKGFPRLNV